MAPVSTTVHIQNIFDALEQLENFEYSSTQLHTFYQNTIPSKSSSKTRSSAYQAFRIENKGNKNILKWSDIKNDPIELSKYQNVAISLNLQRGFTTQDPKIINKHKSEQRKLLIQAALDFEKQKKKNIITTTTTTTPTITFDDIDLNKDGVITREEFDKCNLDKPISSEPEEVTDEPAEEVTDEPTEEVTDEPAEEVTDEPEEEVTDEPAEVTDEPAEVTDEPEEEVTDEPEEEVTDEPEEEVTDEPEEEVTDEPEEEVTDEPEEEVIDEPEEEVTEDPLSRLNLHQDEKPLYTGKNNSSALNNFKQWILNKNELPFNSTIPNSDMKEYKIQYNFDKNKYLLDDECPWFEFIKNNMSIQ